MGRRLQQSISKFDSHTNGSFLVLEKLPTFLASKKGFSYQFSSCFGARHDRRILPICDQQSEQANYVHAHDHELLYLTDLELHRYLTFGLLMLWYYDRHQVPGSKSSHVAQIWRDKISDQHLTRHGRLKVLVWTQSTTLNEYRFHCERSIHESTFCWPEEGCFASSSAKRQYIWPFTFLYCDRLGSLKKHDPRWPSSSRISPEHSVFTRIKGRNIRLETMYACLSALFDSLWVLRCRWRTVETV